MRQEFSIIKRRGKKGPIYYVRYFMNNKMIPSQWSTGTENLEEAVMFSISKKDTILKKYFNRKEGRTLYKILADYYAGSSSYLAIDAVRGRKLGESSRRILHGFIVNTFVPFLRKNKIKEFSEINAVLMNRFQNHLLLEKNNLPQSINRQISGIKAIFSHLYMTGIIENNTIRDTVPLRTMNRKIRGCFCLDELKGIFKTTWPDKKSYLLCALIYTAGLRNSEISSLKPKNITVKNYENAAGSEAKSIYFLNIQRSKTIYGIRKIPLHPKIKEALDQWVAENNLSENDFLFIKNETQKFYRMAKNANDRIGSMLGKETEELSQNNITFYSGRHFYKTMLNSRNLGDIEELFMGHSVNKNVSELYNHKDKRGEQELLKAASRTIEIIDECFFR